MLAYLPGACAPRRPACLDKHLPVTAIPVREARIRRLLEGPMALCHSHGRPFPGGGARESMDASGLMRGKRGLVMGVANNRSIAWGIAKSCRAQGAELAFTYQGDSLKKRVEPLAEEVGGLVAGHCDVTDAASIDAVFGEIATRWGSLDFVVHAIA